jgi:hypothetical protein
VALTVVNARGYDVGVLSVLLPAAEAGSVEALSACRSERIDAFFRFA